MPFENKKEPILTDFKPVNADVDLENLRKQPETTTKVVEGVDNYGTFGLTQTLGLGKSAGVAHLGRNIKQHIVTIMDFSKKDAKRYNYLVHCDTCGIEGRYEYLEQAEGFKNDHINGHKSKN